MGTGSVVGEGLVLRYIAVPAATTPNAARVDGLERNPTKESDMALNWIVSSRDGCKEAHSPLARGGVCYYFFVFLRMRKQHKLRRGFPLNTTHLLGMHS